MIQRNKGTRHNPNNWEIQTGNVMKYNNSFPFCYKIQEMV